MENGKRLIDANALIERCKDIASYEWNHRASPVCWADAYEQFADDVEAEPTVDAVEVVHGRWFMRGGIFRCSECDSKALLKLDSNVGGCREYTHFRSNYCPNCGAKMMDGGNEDG
jgi:DNA-directed RNA polymerase subunit RPC12/RpoP